MVMWIVGDNVTPIPLFNLLINALPIHHDLIAIYVWEKCLLRLHKLFAPTYSVLVAT